MYKDLKDPDTDVNYAWRNRLGRDDHAVSYRGYAYLNFYHFFKGVQKLFFFNSLLTLNALQRVFFVLPSLLYTREISLSAFCYIHLHNSLPRQSYLCESIYRSGLVLVVPSWTKLHKSKLFYAWIKKNILSGFMK